jgi:hypothetical protein
MPTVKQRIGAWLFRDCRGSIDQHRSYSLYMEARK